MQQGSDDDCVYLPYTTAMRLSNESSPDSYSAIMVDEGQANEAKAAVEQGLYDIFKSDSAYYVYSASEWLEEMNKKHKPERVVIEYNGMWLVSEFEKMKLPAGCAIEQKITTVDASTFQMYLTNLKPLFVEMVKGAELVLFNRCEDKKPLAGYRRCVKVVSPQAEVIFEDENGEVDNIFEDEVPYDLKAPVIEIPREDYGIWYMDVSERPEVYAGKKVRFKGQVLKNKYYKDKKFDTRR